MTEFTTSTGQHGEASEEPSFAGDRPTRQVLPARDRSEGPTVGYSSVGLALLSALGIGPDKHPNLTKAVLTIDMEHIITIEITEHVHVGQLHQLRTTLLGLHAEAIPVEVEKPQEPPA